MKKNCECVFCNKGDLQSDMKYCELMGIHYHKICLEISKIGFREHFYEHLLATVECARN